QHVLSVTTVVFPRVRSRKGRKGADTRPPFERVLRTLDPRCGLQADFADAPVVEEVRDFRPLAMVLEPAERIDPQEQLAGSKSLGQRRPALFVTKHADIKHRQARLAHDDLSTEAIAFIL